MKIVIAPDSFKESLSAWEAANHIEAGLLKVRKDIDTLKIPLADGGEGTVDALVKGTGGKYIKTKVMDPLNREIEAIFGILGDAETAVIEMTAASGIALLKNHEKDPLVTSTYGTGQLIRRALDEECKKIIIGLGGSATNDGGAGMAQALGIKFLDDDYQQIGPGGGQLSNIKLIDVSGIDPRLKNCRVIAACDVNNPLTGPGGASRVYGPQKGADEKSVELLDKNLKHYAALIHKFMKIDVDHIPGAGAAGGIAAGLMAFCNAYLKPGFDIIKTYLNLEEKIKNADLIITGEGKIDAQTKYGKTPYGMAQLAKKYSIPVIGLAGMLGNGYEELYQKGFKSLFSIADRPMGLDESMERAAELLASGAERVFRAML